MNATIDRGMSARAFADPVNREEAFNHWRPTARSVGVRLFYGLPELPVLAPVLAVAEGRLRGAWGYGTLAQIRQVDRLVREQVALLPDVVGGEDPQPAFFTDWWNWRYWLRSPMPAARTRNDDSGLQKLREPCQLPSPTVVDGEAPQRS